MGAEAETKASILKNLQTNRNDRWHSPLLRSGFQPPPNSYAGLVPSVAMTLGSLLREAWTGPQSTPIQIYSRDQLSRSRMATLLSQERGSALIPDSKASFVVDAALVADSKSDLVGLNFNQVLGLKLQNRCIEFTRRNIVVRRNVVINEVRRAVVLARALRGKDDLAVS